MLEGQVNVHKTWILSLVSNENLSKIPVSSGWAIGQVAWAKLQKTYLMMSLIENTNFFLSLQTRRLAASFEGLNSSLVQSAGELWNW